MRAPVVIAAAALTLGAWTTAPAPAKYRIDLKSSQVVDLTALGQGEQKTSSGMSIFIAIKYRDTTGGRAVDYVLDSLKPDSGSPVPQSMADSARGLSWHGLIDAQGVVREVKSASQNPLTAQLTGAVRTFLPRIKPGLKAGDSWTDTTEAADDIPNGSLATRTVSNHQATGESYNGVKAIRIATASSSSFSGNQQTPGGAAAIEGTGSSSATQYVGPDWTYLGGNSTSTQSLLVSGPFAPEPIPVTVTTEAAVALLK